MEQFVKGDLKVEVEEVFGHYLSSGLFAGSQDHWVEVADRDEGWGRVGVLAWLLPFGLSPLRSRWIEYRGWHDVESTAPGSGQEPFREAMIDDR